MGCTERCGLAADPEPIDLDPVDPRHPQVHQDDVGREPLGHLDRLVAVHRRLDHLDVLKQVENQGEALADHPLVVGEQDPDRRGGGGSAHRTTSLLFF